MGRLYRLNVYQSERSMALWYWRITAPNGKTIADGGEGYESRRNAIRAARRLRTIAEHMVIA